MVENTVNINGKKSLNNFMKIILQQKFLELLNSVDNTGTVIWILN